MLIKVVERISKNIKTYFRGLGFHTPAINEIAGVNIMLVTYQKMSGIDISDTSTYGIFIIHTSYDNLVNYYNEFYDVDFIEYNITHSEGNNYIYKEKLTQKVLDEEKEYRVRSNILYYAGAILNLCTIGVTYLEDSHRFIVEDNKRDIYSFYLKYKDVEEHEIEKLSDGNDRIFNYYDRDIIG